MQTEYLVVDQRCQGQVVEEIGEKLPYVGIAILAEAFVVETVYLGDLTRFMITSKNGDPLRVSNLECNEESDRFD